MGWRNAQRVPFPVAILGGSQLTVTLAGRSDPLFWFLWAPTHKWHEQIHAYIQIHTFFFKKNLYLREKQAIFVFLHLVYFP